MELCDDQSLFDFICISTHRVMAQKERETNEKQLIGIFYQVCDALRYLHERGLVHNDISLSNILRQGPQWKLSDFSLVKRVDSDEQQNVTTLGVTRPFAPPEKVLDRKFSAASDMYSFGVAMFVAISGSLELFEKIGKAYQAKQAVNAADHVRDLLSTNQSVICTINEDFRTMLISLVEHDYKKRPTAA